MPAIERRRRARGRRELKSARSRSMRGYYTAHDALGIPLCGPVLAVCKGPGSAGLVCAIALAPARRRRGGRERRQARDALLRPAGLPVLQAPDGSEFPQRPIVERMQKEFVALELSI